MSFRAGFSTLSPSYRRPKRLFEERLERHLFLPDETALRQHAFAEQVEFTRRSRRPS